jgi:hypothetical protein
MTTRPFQMQGPPLTWAQRLESAETPEEVVSIAREFIAQFTPYEIHALPAPCKPPAKFVDEADIGAYAYALVRHECEDNAEHAQLVHKMAAFFSTAAKRIAELLGPRDDLQEIRQTAA